MQKGRRDVLLYDGLCPMCNSAVRFVLRTGANSATQFSPLAGEYAKALLERHPQLASEDSVILVTTMADGTETIRMRSDAVLALMSQMNGWTYVAKALRLIPRPIRDAAYNVIAQSRSRLSGRYNECPLPALSVRDRFIP